MAPIASTSSYYSSSSDESYIICKFGCHTVWQQVVDEKMFDHFSALQSSHLFVGGPNVFKSYFGSHFCHIFETRKYQDFCTYKLNIIFNLYYLIYIIYIILFKEVILKFSSSIGWRYARWADWKSRSKMIHRHLPIFIFLKIVLQKMRCNSICQHIIYVIVWINITTGKLSRIR